MVDSVEQRDCTRQKETVIRDGPFRTVAVYSHGSHIKAKAIIGEKVEKFIKSNCIAVVAIGTG